jgi:hypothetical protein
MPDGSPTSGGTGDQVLTIDTFTDTATGTSGIKIAVGGLRKVILGRDLGDIGPTNEVDVQDARHTAATIRQALTLRQAFEFLIARLESPLVITNRPARNVKTSSVSATTGSTKILDAAIGRINVLIYNDATSTGNLFLSFGVDASGSTAGLKSLRLVPGAYYEVPSGMTELPMMGLWDSATAGFCDITEAY